MKKTISNLCIVCFFLYCNKPNFKKFCDINSSDYWKTFILKRYVLKDNSAYCNIPEGTISRVIPPSTTPAPSSYSPIPSVVAGNFSTPQNINFTTTAPNGFVKCTTNGIDPTNLTQNWNSTNIYNLAGLQLKCGVFINTVLSGPIVEFKYTYQLVKTGLAAVHIANDDGDLKKGSTRGYVDNGDETITDNYSGLNWQKCAKGLSGPTCTGGSSDENWTSSVSYCSSLTLAGKTWRLPNLNELADLGDYSMSGMAIINATFFPNTPNAQHWSSNEFIDNTSNAFWYSFSGGVINTGTKITLFKVRCVSGSQKLIIPNIDNLDGTITDNQTGLLWQKCSIGMNNDATCTGTASTPDWSTALSNCNALTLSGKTWRLPNLNELRSILDLSKNGAPRANSTFFPNTQSNIYWTSTSQAANLTSNDMIISFNSGQVTTASKAGTGWARCVSGP